MGMIDAKTSNDEMIGDISNITSNMSKLVQEVRAHKKDCTAFNEVSLRDNSFARWLWTKADLVHQGDFLAWDHESANTHPQLYRWWKPTTKEYESDGSMIVVEHGGLYELQFAFFINSAMT